MMSVIHSCELSPAYVYHFKKTRFAIIREMTERSKSIFTNKEWCGIKKVDSLFSRIS